MKFSILIANYNNGKYFKDCYDSIITQTYNDWEAIIVDDGSTDDSATIIQGLIKGDDRFRFFENDKNYGCGFTKNRCASLATGNVLGFLDPDDALTTEAIESMMKAHNEHSDISLVHSLYYRCNGNLEKEAVYTLGKSISKKETFTNFYGQVAHFATFKKSFYEKTIGIDKKLRRAVDQDLYLKLHEKAGFYFLNRPLYLYRFHPDGIATGHELEALYNHIKVLVNAESRTGINYEQEFKGKILSMKEKPFNWDNLENPRYLIGRTMKVFWKNPLKFFKRLLIREK